MNIFQKVKAEVDFLQCMEHYIGPLKQCGDDTYTTEEDECPVHGGHGCFRMKYDGEDSIVNCFGNCDHEDWPVDMIEFVRIHKGLETAGESARLIAKDFGIRMPVDSLAQRIFTDAAAYYRHLYLTVNRQSCLGKRTPPQYQEHVRHHKIEALDRVNIGWSDGCLKEHMEEKGYTTEELIASGLVSEKNGRVYDTFPEDSFMYPHYWMGKVSRFTFKNMKGRTYQLKKQFWLNEVDFYKVGTGSPIAVVEGENDLLSILDEGWTGTILCTNGSLSKSQIDWMVDNPGEYHTFWDADPAGEKYADKLWRQYVLGKMPHLHQWAIPKGDVDDYLKEFEMKDLTEMQPPEKEDLISVTEKVGATVVESNGCYKIVKTDKDGNETYIPISNFAIRLLYVKEHGEERSRVVRLIRNDGRTSKPVVVNSEAKVSVRHWKILVANAVDAGFTGNESELDAVWAYVYDTQKEAVVRVPDHVGDVDGAWLFGNQYLLPHVDVKGDKDAIMWEDEECTRGIAPKSMMASLSTNVASSDIPRVWHKDNIDEFIGTVCHSLDSILKDPGMVLSIMGWMRMCAYSMPLYYEAKLGFFPFLLLWGRHGRGKSTLANWMLSMYDMADKGTTTVGQLRSGVGIERKLAYYRGLPYCIDELRADRQASDYSRTWRGWYNRSTRVKGTRSGEGTIQVPLNACLFFSGQDTFTDPAMRSRCIPCKFPKNAGDVLAYNWMEDNTELLPTVGYHWIKEALNRDIKEVKAEIDELKDSLREVTPGGVQSRSVYNYAMIAYFAKGMAETHFPDFDYTEWLVSAMKEEHMEAVENDMVSHFFEGMAGLQIGDRPPLNGNHMMVKDGKLYIWYSGVFGVVAKHTRSDNRESFSKGAVRDALKEETYFEGESTKRIGPTNTSRRCFAFDLTHRDAPQELLAIAETARNSF